MSPSRRPIVLIVPVWGRGHVARFLDRVLPSWLAPGNLPALARERAFTVVFLTDAAEAARMRTHALVGRFETFAAVRIEAIDDLIASGVATVTLTLAFTRGAALGRKLAPDAAVVFLNADFLLADGSLAHLAGQLDAGAEMVLAPSLRAVEEVVRPRHDALRAPEGTLTVPSRELVKVALDALHPTVTACRLDQQRMSSAHPNQFFWRVNDETLICRSMLLFPLAVVPRRDVEPAVTFCDYGFIEQLAPDATPVALADSDSWFALELCPARHESWLIREGGATTPDLARSLSAWSTAFHRAQLRHRIVIHAGDPGGNLTAASAEADRRVSKIVAALGPAIPAAHHPYWISGAHAWRRLRREAGLPDAAPELGDLPPDLPQTAVWGVRLRQAAGRLLVGRPGRRFPWQPGWAGERLLRAVMSGGAAAPPMPLAGDEEVLHDLMPMGFGSERPASPDSSHGTPVVGCELADGDGDAAERLLERIGSALETTTEVMLVVRLSGSPQVAPANPAEAESSRLLERLGRRFTLSEIGSLDDRFDHAVQGWHRELAMEFHQSTVLRRLVLMLRSVAGTAALLAISPVRALAGRKSGSRSTFIVMKLKRRPQDDAAPVSGG
jgi:hypothetical protein